MTEFSFLETTAEVSVTFAGFIGIFLVLVTRDGQFAPADSVSIRSIVLGSILSVFYSAVPLVLYSLGVSGDTLWRISSGAIGLCGALVINFEVRQMLALSAGERASTSNLVSVFLAALAFLCCLLNVLGWPWPPSLGVYLLAVWLVIGIAGVSFVVLIFRRVL